jgi:predicted secreted Zn-dependent protease
MRSARIATLVAAAIGAINAIQAQAAARVPAEIDVVEKVRYYELHGRTVAELAADLRRLGPKDADGRLNSAFTDSRLQWRYGSRAVGNQCGATDVRVTAYTDVVMPQWTPPADTEPGLAASWAASMAGLAVHEGGHKEITVEYAKRIRDGIAALRAPCARFSEEANAASNRLIGQMREAQARYDAETQHGFTQGTRFPPRRPPAVRMPGR